MKNALLWWKFLTNQGRDQFPRPKNEKDILHYYNNVEEYVEQPCEI